LGCRIGSPTAAEIAGAPSDDPFAVELSAAAESGCIAVCVVPGAEEGLVGGAGRLKGQPVNSPATTVTRNIRDTLRMIVPPASGSWQIRHC